MSETEDTEAAEVEVKEEVNVGPAPGAIKLVIDGDESRRGGRKYRWRLLKWRTSYWSSNPEKYDWYPVRASSDRDLQGFARTQRKAELRGRQAACQFQLVSPADPGLVHPTEIEM